MPRKGSAPARSILTLALLAILVFSVFKFEQNRARQASPPAEVSTESLANRCRGYNLRREEARDLIKAELQEWAAVSGVNTGSPNLEAMGRHASSARSMIETARVCGGYNTAELELTDGDLLIVGMKRP